MRVRKVYNVKSMWTNEFDIIKCKDSTYIRLIKFVTAGGSKSYILGVYKLDKLIYSKRLFVKDDNNSNMNLVTSTVNECLNIGVNSYALKYILDILKNTMLDKYGKDILNSKYCVDDIVDVKFNIEDNHYRVDLSKLSPAQDNK